MISMKKHPEPHRGLPYVLFHKGTKKHSEILCVPRRMHKIADLI